MMWSRLHQKHSIYAITIYVIGFPSLLHFQQAGGVMQRSSSKMPFQNKQLLTHSAYFYSIPFPPSKHQQHCEINYASFMKSILYTHMHSKLLEQQGQILSFLLYTLNIWVWHLLLNQPDHYQDRFNWPHVIPNKKERETERERSLFIHPSLSFYSHPDILSNPSTHTSIPLFLISASGLQLHPFTFQGATSYLN